MKNISNMGMSLAGCALLATVGAVPLAAAADSSNAFTLEEVIVTATKRSTSLQDTPYSISALGDDVLKQLGAVNFRDFVGSVAGLDIRDGGSGKTKPVIRGLEGVGEALVATYYDEAVVVGGPGTSGNSGRWSPQFKVMDVDHIEVLKGPQGTLYGAGSMGGTIRVISNKPQFDDFTATVSGEVMTVDGGDQGYDVSAIMNVPLSDKLAARVVLYDYERPGFSDNTTLGLEDFDSDAANGARVALRWQATEDTTLDFTYMTQDRDLTDLAAVNITLDQDYVADKIAREPFTDEQDLLSLVLTKELDFADLTIAANYYDHSVVETFGSGRFSTLEAILSRPGFQAYRDAFANDPDPAVAAYSQNPWLSAVQPNPITNSSFEARLVSNTDAPLEWSTGVYWQERDSDFDSQVYVTDINGEPNLNFEVFHRRTEQKDTQKAIFGEVSYPLTDKLTVTGGIRYFDIDIEGAYQNIRGFGAAVDTPAAIVPGNPTETGTTGKLHLGWQKSDDVLLYTQFSQGFRAGGLNQRTESNLLDIPAGFESDTVDNYEIGLRSTWFDGRLVVNGAAYLMDWTDTQVQSYDSTGLFRFVQNVGETEVTGIELELTAQLSDSWTFRGNFSSVSSELSADAPLGSNGTDANGLIVGSQTGLKGDPTPNVPDATVSLSLEYRWDMAGTKQGYVFNNLNYVGKSFNDYNAQLIRQSASGALIEDPARANPFYFEQGGYTTFDIRAGIEDPDNWSAYVYVTNLFGETKVTRVLSDSFQPNDGYVTRPRSVGLGVSKSF